MVRLLGKASHKALGVWMINRAAGQALRAVAEKRGRRIYWTTEAYERWRAKWMPAPVAIPICGPDGAPSREFKRFAALQLVHGLKPVDALEVAATEARERSASGANDAQPPVNARPARVNKPRPLRLAHDHVPPPVASPHGADAPPTRASAASVLPARRLDDFARAAQPLPDIEAEPTAEEVDAYLEEAGPAARAFHELGSDLRDRLQPKPAHDPAPPAPPPATNRPQLRAVPSDDAPDRRQPKSTHSSGFSTSNEVEKRADLAPGGKIGRGACGKCGARDHNRRTCPLQTKVSAPETIVSTDGVEEGDLGGAAALQEKTHNFKLAPMRREDMGTRPDGFRFRMVPLPPFCAATFVSIQQTCPASCPFKRDADGANGCFADSGFSRILAKRLDLRARVTGVDGVQAIREEVRALDAAFRGGRVPQDGRKGGRDLRLHVGGDVPDTKSAELLAGAAQRWRKRGGGAVFSYTHAWREVPRAAWGPVSVLASIELPADAARARAQGYQPAIVVDRFPDGPRVFEEAGQSYVPCPAEINPGKVTCVSCRLCFDDAALRRRGLGIAFAVHGKDEHAARTQLVQIRTPGAPPPARVVKQRKCGACGETGHFRKACPNPPPPVVKPEPLRDARGRVVRTCSICRQPGHRRETCPTTGGDGIVLERPLTGRLATIAERAKAQAARERAKTWAAPAPRDFAAEALADAALQMKQADEAAGVVVLPPAPVTLAPREPSSREWSLTSQRREIAVDLALRPLSKADQALLDETPRPKVYGDCCVAGLNEDGSPRPRGHLRLWDETAGETCPWVACAHHLAVEIGPTGGLRVLSGWDDGAGACALELAERGGMSLEETGGFLGVTREMIRQNQARGLAMALYPAKREHAELAAVRLASDEHWEKSKSVSLEVDAAAMKYTKR